MNAILYGVGVGPGDPELLTIKATRLIQTCDVVAIPSSGSGDHMALDIAREYIQDQELLYCHLPMTRDPQVLEQCRKAAADSICALLDQGKNVAYLTIGDPGIYATYSYIHKLVEGAGHTVEVVPGIPSFCAAAAALKKPLCENEEPLHILPASMEGLSEALDSSGTKVLMKMGRNLDSVAALLEEKGLLERTSLVEKCTLPGEVVVPHLEKMPHGNGYFTVLVVEDGCV